MKTHLLRLSIVLLLAACHQPEVPVEEPSLYSEEQVTAFKYWLKATLSRLDVQDGVTYTVGDDSLNLSIRWPVDTMVTSDRWADLPKLSAILTMLEEYQEYPKPPFRIRYVYLNTYVISPVTHLLYEETDELENMIVTTRDTSIEYSYIRGRFSEKVTKVPQAGGDTLLRRTHFLWEGNRLIKKDY